MKIPGGNSSGEIPVPIPNTEVKSATPKILGWRRPGKIGTARFKILGHRIFGALYLISRGLLMRFSYGCLFLCLIFSSLYPESSEITISSEGDLALIAKNNDRIEYENGEMRFFRKLNGKSYVILGALFIGGIALLLPALYELNKKPGHELKRSLEWLILGSLGVFLLAYFEEMLKKVNSAQPFVIINDYGIFYDGTLPSQVEGKGFLKWEEIKNIVYFIEINNYAVNRYANFILFDKETFLKRQNVVFRFLSKFNFLETEEFQCLFAIPDFFLPLPLVDFFQVLIFYWSKNLEEKKGDLHEKINQ